MPKNKEHIIDCIQLINSENIGPVTFFKLLQEYGSVKNALAMLPKLKKFSLFSRSAAEVELAKAEEKGVRILTFDDDEYPDNLKQIDDAPPLLYVLGRSDILNSELSLAIVGSRNASINGRKTASRIAYDLTNYGVTIISGMARGIDSAAHKGAMYAQQQKGTTIAVLGTGVDVPYPKENSALYEQILQNGAIVSEFPLGTQPQATNFPRRNRIVSALSKGTLIVEAATNSGSLITARLALEQGKDIFAIPGAPNDERASGPNKLIKEGAVLVENAEDILSVLSSSCQKKIKKESAFSLNNFAEKNEFAFSLKTKKTDTELCAESEEKTKIIDYISFDGVYVDEVIRACGEDASLVALELLELEMSGVIIRLPGNKVARLK